ncbi:alpha-E domain-containing protein [Paenibacillus sp. WST5]|uniref:Alpha-E domain-containing protein n=2 Tax=Paenibacillus sedimenti TaxID=2770274 RepID=A0A926KR81_9BACL|nr:alpha-E domain-containing protein [Paenibacillus sedimenti]
MMGRTAEALFWIGRYAERTENHARLIDVYYHIREEKESGGQSWSRLIDTIGDRTVFAEQYGSFTEQHVLQYITLDKNNSNSLLACTNHARTNLRNIREKMPGELWDILNGLYLWLKEKEVRDITTDSPHLFFRFIRDSLSMFQGAATSVMPRENEWFFVETGRYLERAENLLRLLQSLCNDYAREELCSYPLMLSVLKSVSGYEAFRRQYADTVSLGHIVKFLMLSESFPRSVSYSFSALESSLRSIEEDEPDLNEAVQKLAKLAGKVKANLACMDDDDILSGKLEMTLHALLESCSHMGLRMSKIFFPSREEVSA